jgi:hypothetical protein
LPELVLIEGIQQVAMKRDESLSPSLFTFRSYFATIHRYYYYDFMTAQGARLSWARTDRLQPLHSLFWLLCVFSNLGNLLLLKANPNGMKTSDSGTVLAQGT